MKGVLFVSPKTARDYMKENLSQVDLLDNKVIFEKVNVFIPEAFNLTSVFYCVAGIKMFIVARKSLYSPFSFAFHVQPGCFCFVLF